MVVQIIRGDARTLPLVDGSVDLIVTSPPYFGLRSYQDGGEHYAGQLGDEATPAEFVDALIDCTREWMRVLKPSGSMWVNLGDKYASSGGHGAGATSQRATRSQYVEQVGRSEWNVTGVQTKSLLGIPWRYALRCIDDLGLILRAELIWSKPNGLPESVTDRVRRSHEQWFHFTLNPRYFSAVDEIREPHLSAITAGRRITGGAPENDGGQRFGADGSRHTDGHALGKLPGSVWTVPTEPLRVPESLGVDHFAAFPTEWPRRIIQGWSPSGVCTQCGVGREPSVHKVQPPSVLREWTREEHDASCGNGGCPGYDHHQLVRSEGWPPGMGGSTRTDKRASGSARPSFTGSIDGQRCLCGTFSVEANTCRRCGRHDSTEWCWPYGHDSAPRTEPAVVLDPFGGTGTTALVAHALGRHGISNDMSADYCRLARWRTTDPGQMAKVLGVPKPPVEVDGQADLFESLA